MTRTVDVDERTSQFDSSHTTGAPTSVTHRSAKVRTFVFTFGIAFTLLYTVLERLNWPLFTYQPAAGKLYFWLHRPLSGEGPPMYWYGWIVNAAIAAFVVAAAITYFVPPRLAERAWTSWLLIVPIVGLVVLGNSLLIYFVR